MADVAIEQPVGTTTTVAPEVTEGESLTTAPATTTTNDSTGDVVMADELSSEKLKKAMKQSECQSIRERRAISQQTEKSR